MLVYADDLSGAAEIAGLGAATGFKSLLRLDVPSLSEGYDLQVVSLDIRSLSRPEARDKLKNAASVLLPDFVKVDSACRGHLALMAEMLSAGRPCILVPQNPSHGRTVNGGIYRIDGVPISETIFAHDPEWPAHDSNVSALGIQDAASEEDIGRIVDSAPQDSLFIGAADLFKAFLRKSRCHGAATGAAVEEDPRNRGTAPWSVITVFGSTVDHGLPFKTMSQDVYEGSKDAEEWTKVLVDEYLTTNNIAFGVGFDRGPAPDGKDRPRRLAATLGKVLKALIGRRSPDLLVIEGGATARACMNAVGMEEFSILGSLAPGVVRLRAVKGGPEIILKPGSYPWPEELKKSITLQI